MHARECVQVRTGTAADGPGCRRRKQRAYRLSCVDTLRREELELEKLRIGGYKSQRAAQTQFSQETHRTSWQQECAALQSHTEDTQPSQRDEERVSVGRHARVRLAPANTMRGEHYLRALELVSREAGAPRRCARVAASRGRRPPCAQ
jgi:hypothetical protein